MKMLKGEKKKRVGKTQWHGKEVKKSSRGGALEKRGTERGRRLKEDWLLGLENGKSFWGKMG